MMHGAIFDMDGVLLDNVEFHLEAFRRLGEEQGHPLTREAVYRVFGRKNEDIFKGLLGRPLSPIEVCGFESRKEEIYRELIKPHLGEHLVNGLVPILDDLSSNGIRIALATSGPPENVDMVLDGLQLRPYFSAIITGREVSQGKPHPEAFLQAASGLDLPAASCLVFEDSLSGVTAALAAGCRCVALTTTHTADELESLSPDLIITDFLGLGCADLKRLWAVPGWKADDPTKNQSTTEGDAE